MGFPGLSGEMLRGEPKPEPLWSWARLSYHRNDTDGDTDWLYTHIDDQDFATTALNLPSPDLGLCTRVRSASELRTAPVGLLGCLMSYQCLVMASMA